MYRLVLNGAERAGEEACQTWGQLLERLDAECAAHGWLVAGVRLDGVDVPAFREPAALGRALAEVAGVEVEAFSPRDLVASGIEDATRAALELAGEAESIGASFRGYEVANANDRLSALAGGLGTFVSLADALSQATGVGLEQVAVDGGSAAQVVGELLGHIEGLLEAQRAGDWITVADILEYDVAPALHRFPGLFGVLCAAAAVPPAPGA